MFPGIGTAVIIERRRESHYRCLKALILTAQAVLLMFSTQYHYATIDEVGHIAAGLSHWQTGTFSAYRVNPPFPRMLATLPVWAAGPVTNYASLVDARSSDRVEWPLGQAFASVNAPRYFKLILLGRIAGVAWALLGGQGERIKLHANY